MIERYVAQHLSKGGKIASIIELSRPWNGAIIGLVSIVGYSLMSASFSAIHAILIFLTFFFMYSAGTTINDIYDKQDDDINMPYRPLQQGRITIKNAKKSAILFYLLGLIIALYLDLKFFIITLSFFVLSVCYSCPGIGLDRKGILGNITLSLVTIFIPNYAGAVYALRSFEIDQTFLLANVSFTLLFLAVSIMKDFKDVKGDKVSGKRTFVLQIGKKRAFILSLLGIVVFFPLSTYLFSFFFRNDIIFYSISLIIFVVLLMIASHRINEDNADIEDERFGRLRLILLPYVLSLLAFSI